MACSKTTNALLCHFVEITKDGYGIYDGEDRLIYCNAGLADIFCINLDEVGKVKFDDVVRNAYRRNRGIHIETQNIEDWIMYANARRRSRPFRSFEVDLNDGRWFLITEQTDDDGSMLVQAKNITQLKMLESELRESVSTLNRLALTDELTQLANRRCFVESVESELSRCKRASCNTTMLLLDLDHFKQVNDTYGHLAGDTALKHVARCLKSLLRQYDIVGRIGGEEFAVFLGNVADGQDEVIAERIRECIANKPVQFEGQQIQITTSIGLTANNCESNFKSMYALADEALYQAKAAGRNRVVTLSA